MTASRNEVVSRHHHTRSKWRLARTFSLLLALALFTSSVCAHAQEKWTATWTASPQGKPQLNLPFNTGLPSTLSDQTVRHVVRVSLGGRRIRIVVSNAYGTAPLVIGAARVGLAGGGASIVAESGHALTFGGKASVTVPPGAPALSDPVDMEVSPLTDLSVSLYFPASTPVDTFHWTGIQTAFIASGDVSAAQSFEPSATTTSRLFLSDVWVEGSSTARAVVAFGDSISDGFASTVDQDRRWPDLLAQRLRGHAAVINAGISANRLLVEGVGTNAWARFERDALSRPGVESAIVLIGINDIGGFGPVPPPALDALLTGYRQLIAQAHGRGVRIIGATLTPFENALAGTPGEGYYTPEKEQVRSAVNNWIRHGREFDAVIDFDAAVRDPSQPTRLLPSYDSGDHLHPNDAGYRAMAASVDLSALFRGR
jgi:lysophospholipase L1-like esterase